MKKRILYILSLLCLINVAAYSTTVPTLLSPANHADWVTTTPTLVWSFVSTTSPTYLVQVSTSATDFTGYPAGHCKVNATVHGWSGTYNVPSGKLTAGTKYYWRVSAYDGANWSTPTQPWDFTPGGGAVTITAPTLSSPEDGADWVSTTPTLVWSYSSTTSLTYRVQVTNTESDWDGDQVLVNKLVTGWSGTYNVPTSAGLTAGRQYWWRVRVNGTTNPWSDPWTFTTTGGSASTSVPNLSAPVDGSTWETTTPTLSWWYSTTAASVHYIVSVKADDSNFSTGAVDYNVYGGGSASKLLPALIPGTTYYWCVTANGGSPSDVWSFTTQGTSPENAIPAFTNVDLEYSRDQGSSKTFYDVSGNMTDGFNLSVTSLGGTPEQPRYYFLTLGNSTATNTPIERGYYPLYITSYPSGFFAFWNEKGVNAAATVLWQAEMWKMINGIDPILYVYSNGSDSFSLVDGLEKNLGHGDSFSKIDDNYLKGTYIFSGTIEGQNGLTSDPISIKITLDDGKPSFTNLQLASSTTNPTSLTSSYTDWAWTQVTGNLANGFSLTLGTAGGTGKYNYLNIESATTNTIVANGYYPFKLDQTSLPATFFSYWAGKGVTSASSTPPASYIWPIIHGEQPILYVRVATVSGVKVFSLVDGFYRDHMGLIIPFRIDDDYPAGDYTVIGKLSSTGNPIGIVMHLNYGTNTITIDNITGKTAGSTVSVPITLGLSGSTSVTNTLIGKFTYDPAILTFKYGYSGTGTLINTNGWNITFINNSIQGQLQFVASGTTPITSQGTLFEINLQIAPSASTSVAIINALTTDWFVNGVNSIFAVTPGSISFTEASVTSTLIGDATGDNIVDINDVVAVINHIYGITPLTGQELTNAANADGVAGVSLDDAIAILNYIANGYWGTTPPPSSSVVEASLQFSDVNLNQTAGLIDLPIHIVNADNIKSLEVKFQYDPQYIDYQTFAAMILDNHNFTNGVELSSGVVQFTFASTESMKGSFNPGQITFRCKDGSLPVGSEIKTEYRLNSGDYKNGPTYRIGTGIVTGLDNSVTKIPSDYELSQNYPNPFNPTTKIFYSLPQNSLVSIKIYDMLGREVKTLINQAMNAGVHSVDWNADNENGNKVTSGVYIYRITAGNFIATKKMIFIK